MRNEKNIPRKTKRTLAITAFIITAILSSIELDLIETPVDSMLQTGSAILAVVAKPALTVFKILF